MLDNKWVKLSLKVAISVGLVALLLRKVNVWDILASLRQITLPEIALYVVVLLAGMAISSYKWRLLVRFKGFDVSFGDCFRYYLTGAFINNFFPSFIGGDAYRAYQVAREDRRFSVAAASVVMDRLTGLLGAMVLSVFFAALNYAEVIRHPVLAWIVLVIAAGLVLVLLLEPLVRTRAWGLVARFVPAKVSEFLGVLHEYWAHKRIFAQAFGLAILFGLVGLALLNAILLSALGIHIGLLNYLSVIFLISIISSIPISVGVPEWAYVVTFGFFGVPAATIVAVAILIRILQMLVTLAALPMYLGSRKKSETL